MAKRIVLMRVADALLLPGKGGITQEKYESLVKELGLQKARATRVPVEMEE